MSFYDFLAYIAAIPVVISLILFASVWVWQLVHQFQAHRSHVDP